MKLTKCSNCGGDVVDGPQKHHHLKKCFGYKTEGIDYVVCLVCGYRSSQLPKHLKIHGLDTRSYRDKFGDVPVYVRSLVEKRNKGNLGTHVKPIPERADAVLCDKCGNHYLQRFARRHLEQCVPAHPDKYEEGRDYVSCPECDAKMLRLGHHLRLKHGWTNDKIQMEANKGLKLMADVVAERWASKIDFKAVQEKREATHLERHGHANPFSDPAIQEKIHTTNLSRYGVDHPMQNEGVRLRQNESAQNGPSGQEVFFDEHTCDNVVYSGMGSRYIRTKVGVRKYGRVIKDLNPDFLVLPDNVLESARSRLSEGKPFDRQKHRTRYVVELLGDWWHSEAVIGVPPEEHEKELIEAYASAGIECLVLWEKDVLHGWEEIEDEVTAWIEKAVADMNENPVYRRKTRRK